MGTHITIDADGFVMDAYRADPAGTPRGAVVVVQEIFGVNSHIRDVADEYAGHGYLAIAPALFDRVEKNVELGYDQDGMTKGIEIARGKLEMQRTLGDVAAAARTARAAATQARNGSAAKVGVVGYCWGGLVCAAAAIHLGGTIDAAVGYYGGGSVTLIDQKPTVPLLLHYGEKDHAIPLSDVEKIKQAWPNVPVYVYEGAEHGFNCDQRASHHAPSKKLAMERTLAFFAENLG